MIITPSHRFKSFQIPWVLVFRFIYYFQTSSTRSNFAFAKLILRINPDLTVVHKYKNTHLPVSFISVAVFSRYFFQPLLWTEDLSYSESSSCFLMLARAPLLTPRPTPRGPRMRGMHSLHLVITFSFFHFFFWRGRGGRVITIWNNKINNKNTEKHYYTGHGIRASLRDCLVQGLEWWFQHLLTGFAYYSPDAKNIRAAIDKLKKQLYLTYFDVLWVLFSKWVETTPLAIKIGLQTISWASGRSERIPNNDKYDQKITLAWA